MAIFWVTIRQDRLNELVQKEKELTELRELATPRLAELERMNNLLFDGMQRADRDAAHAKNTVQRMLVDEQTAIKTIAELNRRVDALQVSLKNADGCVTRAYDSGKRDGYIQGSEAGLKMMADAQSYKPPIISIDAVVSEFNKIQGVEIINLKKELADCKTQLDQCKNLVVREQDTKKKLESVLVQWVSGQRRIVPAVDSICPKCGNTDRIDTRWHQGLRSTIDRCTKDDLDHGWVCKRVECKTQIVGEHLHHSCKCGWDWTTTPSDSYGVHNARP